MDGGFPISRAAADAALTRLGVDHAGLDALDRRYLFMIAEQYRGGPVGVEALAAGLSEPRDTVEDVLEPYLIQQPMSRARARGRALLPAGWKHIGIVPPAAAAMLPLDD